jgi:uncharacterized protein (DUF1330 family)
MNIKYALAIGAGFALGAAVVQGLHAQAKPPAYFIAEITVNDQEAFIKEFSGPATKAIQAEGGAKFIARGAKPISTQGAPPAPRVTAIQFDSMDKAQAWWNSPANKDIQAIGQKYATVRSYLVEGVSP